jgi:hypothetical protein
MNNTSNILELKIIAAASKRKQYELELERNWNTAIENNTAIKNNNNTQFTKIIDLEIIIYKYHRTQI